MGWDAMWGSWAGWQPNSLRKEGNSAVGLISHHPFIDAKKVLLAPPLYEQSLSFILGPHNQVFFLSSKAQVIG
jgi:hypothetical protein